MFLFSVVHDLSASTNNFNKDLKKINDWATQCKMSLNPEPTKEAQEVIFSGKIRKISHSQLNSNNTNFKQLHFKSV